MDIEKIKYWDYNKQEYRLRNKPTRKLTYNQLQNKIDTLNKGIDELIEKYNERYDQKGFYLDVESEIIFIIDKNQGHSLLPFRNKRMYKGMESNEPYTLEQLGLEE